VKFGESFLDIDQSIDIIIQSKGFLIRLLYRYIADINACELGYLKSKNKRYSDKTAYFILDYLFNRKIKIENLR